MTRLLWYRRAVGLMLLGIVPVASRQAAEQQAGAVIRVTVNLVQVDATVTDSKGRHAADLKPQDFEIFEDGKPQRITQFSYVPVVAHADAPAHFDLPPHSVSGKLPEAIPRPVPALRPEEVQRTIVLMADDLGLTPDDIPRVRSAMKSSVDREMQPSDLAAVMIASGGMGSMQQLTNDKRQLNAAMEGIHYFAGTRPGWTWHTPIEQPTAFERAASRFGCTAKVAAYKAAMAASSKPRTIRDPLTRIGRLIRLGFSDISLSASVRDGGFSFMPRSRYNSFRELRKSL